MSKLLGNPRQGPPSRRWLFSLVAIVSIALSGTTFAADLTSTRALLHKGEYDQCIAAAEQAIEDGEFSERWRLMLIEALLRVGEYPKAESVYKTAIARYTSSIRLRVLGHEVFQHNGDALRAKLLLNQINELVSARPWWYTDAVDLIAQGKTALLLDADPRQVLEILYDRALKDDPNERAVYLAMGQLALDKYDYAEAAKTFDAGVKRFPNDADLLFGQAMAYASSDGNKAGAALDRVLTLNPNHADALLARADHLINGEFHEEAEQVLSQLLGINPAHEDAWAYAAVLAHLNNDSDGESLCRRWATQFWKKNPRIDYLIGLKLSQKYRFAEGAALQRAALKIDADYLPAKMQLGQDLLRLGQVEEGWKLVNEVLEKDGFNVVAFNLTTLHDRMAKFKALEDEHFIVRMEAKEADIYGHEVLALLNDARTALTKKYGMKLNGRVTVEIFPNQSDFAIRTFGMPGGTGYLGVCFGNVITANSPAAMGANKSNWKAVLWHEFCHVVTLQATRNRMPRWLSEGISVYEEIQANGVWGQSMNPTYRQMILDGELTPVGKLSAAFLRAKSALHVQFAYYQSSLVVEYLVKKSGLEAMQRVLADLHTGVFINQALETHVAPIAEIEREFEAFAKQRAESLAPNAKFDSLPEGLARNPQAVAEFVKANPNHFPALLQYAAILIAQEKLNDAKAPLQQLIKLYPTYSGGDSPYVMLAHVHRKLNETKKERQTLETFAAMSADHVPTFLRLLELDAHDKNWKSLATNAERVLAVNPLIPQPYRHLAEAAKYLNDNPRAIRAYRTLLLMDPADPAHLHYRLAALLHEQNDPEAKRHVLQAIEEAPRFRDAHKLLLKMKKTETPPAKSN